MKTRCSLKLTLIGLLALCSTSVMAKQTLVFEPTSNDMTPVVRAALEKVKDDEVKIVFKKGIYKFLPDFATSRYSKVTNHGNGVKNVIFPLDNFKSVEVDGGGSEFIFHGQSAPFQLYNNDNVTIRNIIVDWDIPFTFVSEIVAVNEKKGYRDVKPWSNSHQWSLEKGQIKFPNVDGFSFTELGSTLAWTKKEKRPVHGALDSKSKPQKVEKLANGLLRIHEKLKSYPPVGSLTSSKGDRHLHRYAPAFQTKNSSNVIFDNVVVYHALGMGFLFERSDNIQVLNSGVHLRDDAQRLISTIADATHFANCKGKILIENSRFENMLDDGTNVHGTYTIVDKVIDEKTLRIKFGHFEQTGFDFVGKGDEVWFIHQPNVERASVATVDSVRVINEMYTEIRFKHNLPTQLAKGDLLENKTWNPEFTMRGTVIRDHRARNVVVKSPLKTIIENNQFSSMMSSILLRGETYFWYESGSVEDVTIRNNSFEYVASSGKEHAVLYITPRLGKSFDQSQSYDKNIKFIDNTISNFGTRIVWADRVDGLLIKDNVIDQSLPQQQLHPKAALFEFANSHNVTLENNTYTGKPRTAVKADLVSKQTLNNDDSIR
ncbi:right-handed parallel beta-helix repeat-containing protein [Psychrosphaera sp. B3R10]|uniref:alpha-1,3-galactosidase-related protein n=1 Tax=unclassified Psychrosphaera TaxID=2641570 RepID=UPI001C080FB8|nr:MULTISPECIES: right-handed parallel beta-helix repeat-containing protein [unclassified Psychrosphaera]MBU2881735.1 right-handed parallel beta-helix repeat-containing protein [Psychrosphaera sp. I2R16]MBU2990080.1 right-handed parallel beta-helix repeat-containing protein [Psychrosphaera sp. B3R10]